MQGTLRSTRPGVRLQRVGGSKPPLMPSGRAKRLSPGFCDPHARQPRQAFRWSWRAHTRSSRARGEEPATRDSANPCAAAKRCVAGNWTERRATLVRGVRRHERHEVGRVPTTPGGETSPVKFQPIATFRPNLRSGLHSSLAPSAEGIGGSTWLCDYMRRTRRKRPSASSARRFSREQR
jgi:hypothetical protein